MKVRFLTDPKVQLSGKANWILLEDFPCEIWREGQTPLIVKVRKGFDTDLASVPRLPGAYMLFGGKARRAAILHDWLYSIGWDRKEADEIFRIGTEQEASAVTAWFMWLGVRVGGSWVYAKKKDSDVDNRHF